MSCFYRFWIVRQIFFCLFIFSYSINVSAKYCPTPYFNNFGLDNSRHIPKQVYYGEELVIPMKLSAGPFGASNRVAWQIPANSKLKGINNICPPFTNTASAFSMAAGQTCRFVLIRKDTKHMLANLSGEVIIDSGYEKKGCAFYHPDRPHIRYRNIKVIPHPITISGSPEQKGTAKVEFSLDLRKYITNFDEQIKTGSAPKIKFSPVEGENSFNLAEIGLSLNKERTMLMGFPNKAGSFYYWVSVWNDYSKSNTLKLKFNIAIDPKDTPIFQPQAYLPTASVNEFYHVNLLSLLQVNREFAYSNQVQFRLDPANGRDQGELSWLRISNDTVLMGTPPSYLYGQVIQVPLIAHSNTGGDSEPVWIPLTIATDKTKRPGIEKDIHLKGQFGKDFFHNFYDQISDPTADDKLKIKIHSVKPEAPWLNVSYANLTALEGNIPVSVAGRLYQIFLRANNTIGGDSDLQSVWLAISHNPKLKPGFRRAKIRLPLLQPGQPYRYDFRLNDDVQPSYDDVPYDIGFAENSDHPGWLYIEDNKLVADQVPNDVSQSVSVALTVKNTPGGESKSVIFKLRVA